MVDKIKEYTYTKKFVAKDGSIREYQCVIKKAVKDKQVKKSKLYKIIKDLEDQDKLKQIELAINKIINGGERSEMDNIEFLGEADQEI